MEYAHPRGVHQEGDPPAAVRSADFGKGVPAVCIGKIPREGFTEEVRRLEPRPGVERIGRSLIERQERAFQGGHAQDHVPGRPVSPEEILVQFIISEPLHHPGRLEHVREIEPPEDALEGFGEPRDHVELERVRVLVRDGGPQPRLRVSGIAIADDAARRRDQNYDIPVRHDSGHPPAVISCVRQHKVGFALRLPGDSRDKACVGLLCHGRRPHGEFLLALVIVDGKVLRVDRGPDECGIEFGGCL